MYVSQRGWFGNNRDVDSLYIGEDIKKKIKKINDYTDTRSYYTTTPSSCFSSVKDVNIFLYVDGENVNVELSEPYSVQETERNIYTYQDVTIKIFDKVYSERKILKVESTEIAKYCEKVQRELNDENIKIDYLTLFELLKKYDLVKK